MSTVPASPAQAPQPKFLSESPLLAAAHAARQAAPVAVPPTESPTELVDTLTAKLPVELPDRLTDADIDGVIVGAKYAVPEGTTITVCILTLKNGCAITGEASCVAPDNFDRAQGRKASYARAREKIWELEGYLLRQKRFDAGLATTRPSIIETPPAPAPVAVAPAITATPAA